MVRRPPFEEANYPPPPGRTTAQWIVLAIVIAGLAVAAAFSYNYWWGCVDWGWVNFCGSVRKP